MSEEGLQRTDGSLTGKGIPWEPAKLQTGPRISLPNRRPVTESYPELPRISIQREVLTSICHLDGKLCRHEVDLSQLFGQPA